MGEVSLLSRFYIIFQFLVQSLLIITIYRKRDSCLYSTCQKLPQLPIIKKYIYRKWGTGSEFCSPSLLILTMYRKWDSVMQATRHSLPYLPLQIVHRKWSLILQSISHPLSQLPLIIIMHSKRNSDSHFSNNLDYHKCIIIPYIYKNSLIQTQKFPTYIKSLIHIRTSMVQYYQYISFITLTASCLPCLVITLTDASIDTRPNPITLGPGPVDTRLYATQQIYNKS